MSQSSGLDEPQRVEIQSKAGKRLSAYRIHYIYSICVAAQIISVTFNTQEAIALTTAEIVAKAKPAVVSIEQIDTINNQAWQGTGWFYGDGKTVVTNAHVLTGTYNVLKVHNVATGKKYTIDHVNYLNVKDDVAALSVREENDAFLVISDVAPGEGSEVILTEQRSGRFCGTETEPCRSAESETGYKRLLRQKP